MLVDSDVLIDAGTGVADLTLAELERIDHVFITHSHLDHIGALPLIVDTVGPMRKAPLTVHCTKATMAILREHVFNWRIWPDFTEIPSKQHPYMAWEAIEVGQLVSPRCPPTTSCQQWDIGWTAAVRASSSPAIPRPTTPFGRLSIRSRTCAS
jgi:ribonuclease BN (tRNA processing enzyme)